MTDMDKTPNPFKANREQIFQAMPENSAILLFTAERKVRSGDTEYPYCQDKDYYYMTGLNEPNGRLIMVKRPKESKTTLFLFQRNKIQAHWFGATLPLEEGKKLSGIKKAVNLDLFDATLARLLPDMTTLFVNYETAWIEQPLPPRLQFVQKIRERFPHLEVKSVKSLIHHKRETKEPWEIHRIEEAIKVCEASLRELMALN